MAKSIVSRAALVINTLGQRPDGMTVSELADRLDQPISSIHRLLQTLVQERIIWQDSREKRYSLSVNLMELTQVLVRDQRLRFVARPYLEKLVKETGDAAFLAALIQDQVISLDSAETYEGPSFSYSVVPFQIMPLHCSASGKAILAYLPPRKIDELLDGYKLSRYTERTITDVATLRSHLVKIREQGYAVCADEAMLGVTALACPILNTDGQAKAAIGICAPTPRFDAEHLDRALNILLGIAQRISVEWGGYRQFVLT